MTSPFNPNMAADLPPIGLRRVVYLEANRAPRTGTGIQDDCKYRDGSYYEPNTEWRDNSTTPPTIWKLSAVVSKTHAYWFIVSSSTGNVTFLEDQVGAHADPAGDGHISVIGSTVANAANPSGIPVETVASTNTLTIQAQVAAQVSGAPADKNDAGLASFEQAQFAVDANGYVSLVGGTTPALQKLNVDAHTGPGTDPVIPDGSGQIIVTGAQVATGTIGANVIRTDSLAVNTMTIEIQRSTAVASTDSTNNGVSHFNSGDFTVDANGFVSLVGATPFTWQVVTETATPASLVNNVGYICASDGVPSALSFALPATSALGDIIEVALNGATSWTITQGAGQQIRWSGSTTTLGGGGSIATTGTGDTIRMVCQVADTIWVGLSGNGNLTVV